MGTNRDLYLTIRIFKDSERVTISPININYMFNESKVTDQMYIGFLQQAVTSCSFETLFTYIHAINSNLIKWKVSNLPVL